MKFWLVALCKDYPQFGSVRGQLWVRLTIRSPKVGMRPYMCFRLLYQLWVQFTPRRKTCDGLKPGTGPAQGLPTVRVRTGPVWVRLIIRSPKIGLVPYMCYRLLYQLLGQFTPRKKTCDGQKPSTGLQPPPQGLSTGRVRQGLVRGEVDHPEPQSRPGAVYML